MTVESPPPEASVQRTVPPPPPPVPEEVKKECVICMDSQRNTIFEPCGHAVCCVQCAEHVKSRNGECPICRTKIRSYVVGSADETLVPSRQTVSSSATRPNGPRTSSNSTHSTSLPNYQIQVHNNTHFYQPQPPPTSDPSQPVTGTPVYPSNPNVQMPYVPVTLPCPPISPFYVFNTAKTFFLENNNMGTRIRVYDNAAVLAVVGTGAFRVSYDIKLNDPQGNLLCKVKSRLAHLSDYYVIKLPDKSIYATIKRSIFQTNTSAHVFQGESERELLAIKGDVLGSKYSIIAADGSVHGYVNRKSGLVSGMLVDVQFQVDVMPGADSLFVLALTILCNCMKNDRKFAVVPIVALGAAATL